MIMSMTSKITSKERLRYETDGDACQKFLIKTLKKTNLGMAQDVEMLKIDFYVSIFLRVQT